MRIQQADTAIDCYHSVVPQFGMYQRDKVLRHIEAHGPSTLGEIGEALNIPSGTVSARATELRKIGLLEWGDKRKSMASTVICKTLRLPVGQLGLC